MKFKQFIKEDDHLESIIDPYVFFFKKDEEMFGGGEDSRVVFAKMKNPDDDMPKGWESEATFTAHNLKKCCKGEPSQHVFQSHDLKKIKVIDKEDAIKEMKKDDECSPKGRMSLGPKLQIFSLKDLLSKHDPDEAPNFFRADEE